MHEAIRGHAMQAWEAIRAGEENPLESLLSDDEGLSHYLSTEQISELMMYELHLGNAPLRARQLADRLASEIKLKAGT